jgi:hypothetical protein
MGFARSHFCTDIITSSQTHFSITGYSFCSPCLASYLPVIAQTWPWAVSAPCSYRATANTLELVYDGWISVYAVSVLEWSRDGQHMAIISTLPVITANKALIVRPNKWWELINCKYLTWHIYPCQAPGSTRHQPIFLYRPSLHSPHCPAGDITVRRRPMKP